MKRLLLNLAVIGLCMTVNGFAVSWWAQAQWFPAPAIEAPAWA